VNAASAVSEWPPGEEPQHAIVVVHQHGVHPVRRAELLQPARP
jgi:hypothetical protein